MAGRKTWGVYQYKSTIGKVAGQFDEINSVTAPIKIEKKDAQYIVGFLVNYCSTKLTDAENLVGLRLRLSSKALGLNNEDLLIPKGGSDHDANNETIPQGVSFIPFKQPPGKSIVDADLRFYGAPGVANTEGLDIGITTVYTNYEPTEAEITNWKLLCVPFGGGITGDDAAIAHAAANTQVSYETLEIPSGKNTMDGHCCHIKPNGITATDPTGGMYELVCAAADDFAPQEWVFPTWWHPALGTVAESAGYPGDAKHYPAVFDLETGKAHKVLFKGMVHCVHATAPDVNNAIRYS